MTQKYYKIVQTIENGRSLLSPVPNLWEKNGILMWPPKNKKEYAIRNPLLAPGTLKDGWTQYNCILKRSFIPTYSQALAELRAMSDRSDTSEAEVITAPKSLKAAKKRNGAIRRNRNADDERYNYNQFVQSTNYLKTEMEADEPEEILILPHQEQIISSFTDKTHTHQGQQQQGQQHQEIQQEEWHLRSAQHIHTEQQPTEQNQEENHTPGQMIVVDNDGELHLYPASTEPTVVMESATTEINSGVLMSIVESIARLENKIEFLIAQNGQQTSSTDKTKDAFKLQSFRLIDSIEELSEFEKKLEGKETRSILMSWLVFTERS